MKHLRKLLPLALVPLWLAPGPNPWEGRLRPLSLQARYGMTQQIAQHCYQAAQGGLNTTVGNTRVRRIAEGYWCDMLDIGGLASEGAPLLDPCSDLNSSVIFSSHDSLAGYQFFGSGSSDGHQLPVGGAVGRCANTRYCAQGNKVCTVDGDCSGLGGKCLPYSRPCDGSHGQERVDQCPPNGDGTCSGNSAISCTTDTSCLPGFCRGVCDLGFWQRHSHRRRDLWLRDANGWRTSSYNLHKSACFLKGGPETNFGQTCFCNTEGCSGKCDSNSKMCSVSGEPCTTLGVNTADCPLSGAPDNETCIDVGPAGPGGADGCTGDLDCGFGPSHYNLAVTGTGQCAEADVTWKFCSGNQFRRCNFDADCAAETPSEGLCNVSVTAHGLADDGNSGTAANYCRDCDWAPNAAKMVEQYYQYLIPDNAKADWTRAESQAAGITSGTETLRDDGPRGPTNDPWRFRGEFGGHNPIGMWHYDNTGVEHFENDTIAFGAPSRKCNTPAVGCSGGFCCDGTGTPGTCDSSNAFKCVGGTQAGQVCSCGRASSGDTTGVCPNGSACGGATPAIADYLACHDDTCKINDNCDNLSFSGLQGLCRADSQRGGDGALSTFTASKSYTNREAIQIGGKAHSLSALGAESGNIIENGSHGPASYLTAEFSQNAEEFVSGANAAKNFGRWCTTENKRCVTGGDCASGVCEAYHGEGGVMHESGGIVQGGLRGRWTPYQNDGFCSLTFGSCKSTANCPGGEVCVFTFAFIANTYTTALDHWRRLANARTGESHLIVHLPAFSSPLYYEQCYTNPSYNCTTGCAGGGVCSAATHLCVGGTYDGVGCDSTADATCAVGSCLVATPLDFGSRWEATNQWMYYEGKNETFMTQLVTPSAVAVCNICGAAGVPYESCTGPYEGVTVPNIGGWTCSGGVYTTGPLAATGALGDKAGRCFTGAEGCYADAYKGVLGMSVGCPVAQQADNTTHVACSSGANCGNGYILDTTNFMVRRNFEHGVALARYASPSASDTNEYTVVVDVPAGKTWCRWRRDSIAGGACDPCDANNSANPRCDDSFTGNDWCEECSASPGADFTVDFVRGQSWVFYEKVDGVPGGTWDCPVAGGPTCGDGSILAPEVCDQGGSNSNTTPDACRTDCTCPRCGDGVADTSGTSGPATCPATTETCDASGASATCDVDCTTATCGDGTLNVLAGSPVEQCDDGDLDNGDGCDSACQIEVAAQNRPSWASEVTLWANFENCAVSTCDYLSGYTLDNNDTEFSKGDTAFEWANGQTGGNPASILVEDDLDLVGDSLVRLHYDNSIITTDSDDHMRLQVCQGTPPTCSASTEIIKPNAGKCVMAFKTVTESVGNPQMVMARRENEISGTANQVTVEFSGSNDLRVRWVGDDLGEGVCGPGTGDLFQAGEKGLFEWAWDSTANTITIRTCTGAGACTPATQSCTGLTAMNSLTWLNDTGVNVSQLDIGNRHDDAQNDFGDFKIDMLVCVDNTTRDLIGGVCGNNVNCDRVGDGTTAWGQNYTVQVCGNGIAEGSEACDGAGEQGTLDCTTPSATCCDDDCTARVCGDGNVNEAAGEECDSGQGGLVGDCNPDCTLNEPACGNGVVDATEDCDDADTDEQDYCHNDCSFAFCGDGWVCDNAATCTSGPGAGIEECDDGNATNGDGCTLSCARQVGVGANLVANSSFTTATASGTMSGPATAPCNGGTTGNWFCYSDGVATVDVSAQRWVYTVATSGGNVQLSQADVAASPSTCYRLQFDGRSEGQNNDVITVLQKNPSPYTNYGLYASPGALGPTMQTYTTSFTTNASATTDARLMFYFPLYDDLNDVFYFDNIRVEPIVPACGNGVLESTTAVGAVITCAGSEECDDGNTTASDGCSATCTLEVAPSNKKSMEKGSKGNKGAKIPR